MTRFETDASVDAWRPNREILQQREFGWAKTGDLLHEVRTTPARSLGAPPGRPLQHGGIHCEAADVPGVFLMKDRQEGESRRPTPHNQGIRKSAMLTVCLQLS